MNVRGYTNPWSNGPAERARFGFGTLFRTIWIGGLQTGVILPDNGA
jgi:hypothetical protein